MQPGLLGAQVGPAAVEDRLHDRQPGVVVGDRLGIIDRQRIKIVVGNDLLVQLGPEDHEGIVRPAVGLGQRHLGQKSRPRPQHARLRGVHLCVGGLQPGIAFERHINGLLQREAFGCMARSCRCEQQDREHGRSHTTDMRA